MTRQAVVIRFPGDPQQLAKSYAEGIRKFQAAHPTVRPEACFLGRTDRKADALVVVLLWPEGTSHEVLGKFLVERLAEVGLPRPDQIDHMAVDAAGWQAFAALG
jgi:hypothetical protein